MYIIKIFCRKLLCFLHESQLEIKKLHVLPLMYKNEKFFGEKTK